MTEEPKEKLKPDNNFFAFSFVIENVISMYPTSEENKDVNKTIDVNKTKHIFDLKNFLDTCSPDFKHRLNTAIIKYLPYMTHFIKKFVKYVYFPTSTNCDWENTTVFCGIAFLFDLIISVPWTVAVLVLILFCFLFFCILLIIDIVLDTLIIQPISDLIQNYLKVHHINFIENNIIFFLFNKLVTRNRIIFYENNEKFYYNKSLFNAGITNLKNYLFSRYNPRLNTGWYFWSKNDEHVNCSLKYKFIITNMNHNWIQIPIISVDETKCIINDSSKEIIFENITKITTITGLISESTYFVFEYFNTYVYVFCYNNQYYFIIEECHNFIFKYIGTNTNDNILLGTIPYTI